MRRGIQSQVRILVLLREPVPSGGGCLLTESILFRPFASARLLLQPQLDQSADGFGTRGEVGLLAAVVSSKQSLPIPARLHLSPVWPGVGAPTMPQAVQTMLRAERPQQHRVAPAIGRQCHFGWRS